jgi:uncharacterized repeat protein (TIGR03803 family)
LIQGFNGDLYGTTIYGGSSNWGTVFTMSTAGVLTHATSFASPNGAYPFAGVVQAVNGSLYGTTDNGGTSTACDGGCGTVFTIAGGVLTTLYSFNRTDGSTPQGGLVRGWDGNFYGVTLGGGTLNVGTIFKITPTGTLTTLHNFNSVNGALPYAQLMQASDGFFYGTTFAGGSGDYGNVYKISPNGVFSVVYNFCTAGPPCADGGNPIGGLVQGSNGILYGTTNRDDAGPCLFGGTYTGCGTVYSLTLDGTFTTLHTFNATDGGNPGPKLIEGTDGNFYGTTPY